MANNLYASIREPQVPYEHVIEIPGSEKQSDPGSREIVHSQERPQSPWIRHILSAIEGESPHEHVAGTHDPHPTWDTYGSAADLEDIARRSPTPELGSPTTEPGLTMPYFTACHPPPKDDVAKDGDMMVTRALLALIEKTNSKFPIIHQSNTGASESKSNVPSPSTDEEILGCALRDLVTIDPKQKKHVEDTLMKKKDIDMKVNSKEASIKDNDQEIEKAKSEDKAEEKANKEGVKTRLDEELKMLLKEQADAIAEHQTFINGQYDVATRLVNRALLDMVRIHADKTQPLDEQQVLIRGFGDMVVNAQKDIEEDKKRKDEEAMIFRELVWYKKEETLAARARFNELVKKSMLCGPLLLAKLSFKEYFGKTKNPNPPDDEPHRNLRFLFPPCLLVTTLLIQIVIYLGLCIGLYREIAIFNYTGTSFLCPGHVTAEALGAATAEGYSSTWEADVVMSGCIFVIVFLLCGDGVASWNNQVLLSDATKGIPPRTITKRRNRMEKQNSTNKGTTQVAGHDGEVKLRDYLLNLKDQSEIDNYVGHVKFSCLLGVTRFDTILALLDLICHNLLTLTIYVGTLFAIFFQAGVGKMIAAVFAATFLAQLDDQLKITFMENSEWGDFLFDLSCAPPEKTERDQQDDEKLAKLSKRITKLLIVLSVVPFMVALGVSIWMLAWTSRGCKPGDKNELEFF